MKRLLPAFIASLVIGALSVASADAGASNVFGFNPESHDFGPGVVNSTSPGFTFEVSGFGGATIATVGLGGTDPGEFTITDDNCTGFDTSDGSCLVDVAFAPTSTGAKSATLDVSDGSTNDSASLAGEGIPAPAGDLVVNTTDDDFDAAGCEALADGDCSLREAITAANGVAGANTITFDIPDSGPHFITLDSPLETVLGETDIDATGEQIGGKPGVVLDGSNLTSAPDVAGLVLTQSTGSLRGFVVQNFDTNTGVACGIIVEGSNWTIAGNFIGTETTGTGAAHNQRGLCVEGDTNTIGGTTEADRNVISGNLFRGAIISGNSNVIQGNFVGTDFTGAQPLGNSDPNGCCPDGLLIEGSSNIIGGSFFDGGDCDGGCNLLSGNDDAGVSIDRFDAAANVIAGNYIGTDVTGTQSIENCTDRPPEQDCGGITIGSSSGANNLIGGTDPGATNLISGNGDNRGIEFTSCIPGPQRVQGNLIGTDVTGKLALPNLDGIEIDDARLVTVGGGSVAARNIIAGNTRDGVRIVESCADGNKVQGNHIGLDIDGDPLGNGRNGVYTQQDEGAELIGGTAPGVGNVIAHNDGSGVVIAGRTSDFGLDFDTSIFRNSIHSNGAIGIDLQVSTFDGNETVFTEQGVTPNDDPVDDDADTGGNGLQNFPDLASASSIGGTLTVEGSLNSSVSETFKVEFFSNPACDPSGHGEGEKYLGFSEVTTDADGEVDFSASVSASVPHSRKITATATDAEGNTSEFSNCVNNIAFTQTCFGAPVTILGSHTADIIVGTSGDDVIVARGGSDLILGLEGNDRICAGAGDDTILGGEGADQIDGGHGNDTAAYAGSIGYTIDISSNPGTASDGDALVSIVNIEGSDGPDVIIGNNNFNTLDGRAGDDTINAGARPDRLEGGKGDDDLFGEGGGDFLTGGRGDSDLCDGGAGTDTARPSCDGNTPNVP